MVRGGGEGRDVSDDGGVGDVAEDLDLADEGDPGAGVRRAELFVDELNRSDLGTGVGKQ